MQKPDLSDYERIELPVIRPKPVTGRGCPFWSVFLPRGTQIQTSHSKEK